MSKIDLLTERLSKRYSPVRTLLILVLLPVIVLLITWGGVSAWNQWGTSGDIRRATDRNWYFSGDPVQVNLSYSASERANQVASVLAPGNKTSEVIFALDVSGSMGSNNAGQPLFDALAAVKMLSRTLLAGKSAVGFLTFNDTIVSFTNPTRDISVLIKAWDGITEGGGTDIAGALEKCGSMLVASSNLPRFIVLVSDGGDQPDGPGGIIRKYGYAPLLINEPIPTDGQKVLFMGVGIGSETTRKFFDTVFYYPHQSSCCDSLSAAELARKILDAAVQGGFIELLGENLVVRDFPHVSAQPYDPEASARADLMILPRWNGQTGALEYAYPYLIGHQTIGYTLRAEALGLHPVAEKPAELAYSDNGETKSAKSGNSPWILVLSPWLLLLLFLPAILYAVVALFSHRRISLADPGEFAPLPPIATLPPVARTQFRRGTLEPLSPSGEDNIIPTAAIAIGRGGAEMLTALFANRLEAGMSRSSDRCLPIYLDCLSDQMAQAKTSPFKECGIDIQTEYLRIPADGEMQTLVQNIAQNNELHQLALDWFDGAKFLGKSLDVSTGCAGDRVLARLALYKDLCSENCRIAGLKKRLGEWEGMWRNRGEQAQIMVLIDPRDDVGSGWIQDIGFHLRRQFGENSIPVYAVLNECGNVNDAQLASANHDALLTELKALQGANGWPWLSLERVEGICLQGAVQLPLFDRVFDLKARQGAMHPAAAAAVIMELMDARALAICHETLANAAVLSRAASQRDLEMIEKNDGLGFLTTVMSTTIVMPILQRHREIVCWVMRDLLPIFFGYSLEGNVAILLQQEGDPQKIWEQAKQIVTNPAPNTLDIWEATLNNERIDMGFAKYDEPEMRREFLMLTVNYLNGSHTTMRPTDWPLLARERLRRFGNMVALTNYFSDNLQERRKQSPEKIEMLERAYTVMVEIYTHLKKWQATILGDEQSSDRGVLQKLAGDLEELRKPDPSLGHGRLEVPHSCNVHDNEKWYMEELKPRVIDTMELPMRLWWVMGADGRSLDILFNGMTDKRLHRKDIAEEQLLPHLFELLRRNLAPEMATWSLESHSPVDSAAKILEGVQHGVSGHSLLFHAFHQERRIDELRSAVSRMVSRERFGVHSYTDRISLLTLSEFSQNYELQKRTSIEQAVLHPLVQPLAKIPAIMYRRHRQSQGRQMPRTDLNASCKLLAQNNLLLSRAVEAVVGNMIVPERKKKVLPYLVFDAGTGTAVALTDAGDSDMEQALLQLILLQRDRDGATIDLKNIESSWSSRSIKVQREALQAFVKNVEEKYNLDDWEQLLMWKARSDLSGLA